MELSRVGVNPVDNLASIIRALRFHWKATASYLFANLSISSTMQRVALLAACMIAGIGSVHGDMSMSNGDQTHDLSSAKCNTISNVLHNTHGLGAFAKGVDAANVSFLNGLLSDEDAHTTFLVVPDERLGSGSTVFKNAHLRLLQHTILNENINMSAVKTGDSFTTSIGTTLEAYKQEAITSFGRRLLVQVDPTLKLRRRAIDVYNGNVYLQNKANSQRVQVYGEIKACKGVVLIVSAFLNAPPSPESLKATAPEASHAVMIKEGVRGGNDHFRHHLACLYSRVRHLVQHFTRSAPMLV